MEVGHLLPAKSKILNQSGGFSMFMTRAMENLVIIKINKVGNPFINSLEDCDGFKSWAFLGLSINKSNQLLKYETIGMEHMYLDLCASNT